MIYGTPLIAQTDVPFDKYIKSLNKPARKNYRYVQKHNQDLEYTEENFDPVTVERFMEIWSKQKIHGDEPVNWAFGISHVRSLAEQGVLRVFGARKGENLMALHFVEKHGNYVEAHPPMYDKADNDRYLAKFMWFNLIKWCCDCDVSYLDFGSGNRGTWPELVEKRKEYPRIAYKWMYIPKHIKDNPKDQKQYVNYDNNGEKGICEADSRIAQLVQGT